MKLALKTTAIKGNNLLDRFVTAVVRAALCTDYPHAGIVINGVLYHSYGRKGLHAVENFDSTNWLMLELGDEADEKVLATFAKMQGVSYDWIELFDFTFLRNVVKLLRKIPKVNKMLGEWMYCYQWCYLAMTGQQPIKRVTAETLLRLALQLCEQRCDKT